MSVKMFIISLITISSLICFTNGFNGAFRCEWNGQYYVSNYVCSDNQTSYYHCIWNKRKYSHDFGGMFHCPSGERCHCFKGEDCDQAEEICIKDIKPLSMIDHGVLTWSHERFYDCSHCDDSNTDLTSVFSYKLQNGKYYREELKSGTYSSYFDRVLYEPNGQGGFTKFNRRDQQKCFTKENVIREDVEQLVKQSIKRDAILNGQNTGNRKQHWKWRYTYAETEKTWDYYLKLYKGELVPILLREQQLEDGMGDGSTLRDTFKYTYYPKLTESNLAEIMDRERKLIEECTK
ncbi:uncharacterized protein [Clytia hemisphaerica]|uniref:Cnidarian restricted protein n=1 Tax=Clytia hemisphaerica TaxID=252671 RepID=A0A7M5VH24_9CNID